MRVLIVKVSSLGDVVHAMPAVQDLRRAHPGVQIDWAVEPGFAPLVQRCEGVERVIPVALRRWRKAPFSAATRAEWKAFRAALAEQAYDAVIDLQGLTKSALVARLARLAPGGRRYAMANRTAGSSYEAPTRWLADVAIPLDPHVHAVERSRRVCAAALGDAVPDFMRYGLQVGAPPHSDAMDLVAPGTVAFIHGSSRDDKCWPEAHWIELGRRLIAQGHAIGLPRGSEAERQRAERIATALGPTARVWPRMDLAALTDALGACAGDGGGAIGVDSGLSHIAVALDLPHVQLYNFDTAWRTGPVGLPRQLSVFAKPTPSVDAVWGAWLRVSQPARRTLQGASA